MTEPRVRHGLELRECVGRGGGGDDSGRREPVVGGQTLEERYHPLEVLHDFLLRHVGRPVARGVQSGDASSV